MTDRRYRWPELDSITEQMERQSAAFMQEYLTYVNGDLTSSRLPEHVHEIQAPPSPSPVICTTGLYVQI